MNDYDVRRAFERIELELIESMKRNLGRHLAEEEKEGFRWNMWQEEQLKSLKAYQRANREKFSKRFSRINEEIEDYIRSNADNAAIAEELRILRKTVDPKATIDDLMDDLDRKDADFFRVNSPKLDELLKATKKDMEKAEHAMLRKTNDQYRKIIFDSQVYANTGAGTLKQAVDMASRDFLLAGINCVEYKGGRLVNIASYAEMAIRTANQRAVLISEGDIRQQHGWHLVRISRYGGCSETCLPWQGRVYVDDVYSGGTKAEAKDTGYPLLSEAIAGGLFHPNCKHRATTFFQGMQNDHSADGEFENEPEQAKHNKYLREIQRQKRIAAGSLDEQNVRVAKNRQRQWEKKIVKLKEFKNDGVLSFEDVVTEMEDHIYELQYERMIAFDDEGNVVLQKSGSEHEIAFEENELVALRGTTIIHNHPLGTTFSPDDIYFTRDNGLRELRATGKIATYRLQSNQALYQLPDYETFCEEHLNLYKHYVGVYKKRYTNWRSNKEKMDRIVQATVIKVLAKKYNLAYSVKKR